MYEGSGSKFNILTFKAMSEFAIVFQWIQTKKSGTFQAAEVNMLQGISGTVVQ